MIRFPQYTTMTKCFLYFLVFLQFLTTQANAYIDPGTGSFIIQSIIAFIAAIGFYLGYPIRLIKKLFSKKLF